MLENALQITDYIDGQHRFTEARHRNPAAADTLREALADLTDSYEAAPPAFAGELHEEMMMLTGLIEETTDGSTSRASKTMMSDAAHKSRRHGRTATEHSTDGHR